MIISASRGASVILSTSCHTLRVGLSALVVWYRLGEIRDIWRLAVDTNAAPYQSGRIAGVLCCGGRRRVLQTEERAGCLLIYTPRVSDGNWYSGWVDGLGANDGEEERQSCNGTHGDGWSIE